MALTLVLGENYANFDPQNFDPNTDKVASVTGVDDKFVTGFKWSYIDTSKKSPFRISRARFEKEYRHIQA